MIDRSQASLPEHPEREAYTPPDGRGATPNGQESVALLTRIALVIALIVAVSPPLSYFWLAYQAQANETAMEAKLHAAFVTQLIIGNAEGWRSEVAALIQQELTETKLAESRTVTDALGVIVARGGVHFDGLASHASANLLDDTGQVAGQLTVARSLNTIILRSGVAALVSLVLAAAILMTLRELPLRALRRVLKALHHEKQVLKESEERLSIVISNAEDGIFTLDPQGRIETFNPAAERLFGYRSGEILGQHIDALLSLRAGPHHAPLSGAVAVGRGELDATRRDGTVFPVEYSLSEAHLNGEQRFIGIVRDITDRRAADEKMSYMANYDSLTGLPNRSLFRDRLTQAMARADRNKLQIALMFLDLDKFKNINDTLGHDVGDALLKHVAHLLVNCLRKCDTVGRAGIGPWFAGDGSDVTVSRLGGDEFTLILEGLSTAHDAEIAAQNVLNACAEHPLLLGDRAVAVSTSIGIAMYPCDGRTLDALIKQADLAMFRSKQLDGNAFTFFSEECRSS